MAEQHVLLTTIFGEIWGSFGRGGIIRSGIIRGDRRAGSKRTGQSVVRAGLVRSSMSGSFVRSGYFGEVYGVRCGGSRSFHEIEWGS